MLLLYFFVDYDNDFVVYGGWCQGCEHGNAKLLMLRFLSQILISHTKARRDVGAQAAAGGILLSQLSVASSGVLYLFAPTASTKGRWKGKRERDVEVYVLK